MAEYEMMGPFDFDDDNYKRFWKKMNFRIKRWRANRTNIGQLVRDQTRISYRNSLSLRSVESTRVFGCYWS